MKKPSDDPNSGPFEDEPRTEYVFDYTKAGPDRFTDRFQSRAATVVLDPDVAEVFGTSESVNNLLRSVISAMGGGAKPSGDPH